MLANAASATLGCIIAYETASTHVRSRMLTSEPVRTFACTHACKHARMLAGTHTDARLFSATQSAINPSLFASQYLFGAWYPM
jgi:hypothetical protein